MKRVASYIRVSTDRQAKEGDSVPAQREALRKYIEDHEDCVCAGEYVDDGVSGRKFEQRGELQRLLDDISDGKVDMIIFTKLDRWFRSIRHYTHTQEVLDKHGVTWLAIWEPIYDTTTPAGRLVVNQMMSIAQFEAENTGSRIRQVNAYKISQGEAITGHIPYGFRIENKHLVISEPEAETIRAAFDYYDRTGKIRETMRYLSEKFGFIRSQINLRKILKNRTYIGEYRGNTNYCPPLVDRAVFESVQRKLEMNVKSSVTHDYIFSGLVRCAVCGGRCPGKYAKFGKWEALCYVCRGAVSSIKTCENSKACYESRIEAYLLDNVEDLVKMEFSAAAPPQKDNAKEIERISRKIDRLKELYINELITMDEYRKDREELEKQKASLAVVEQPEKPSRESLEAFIASGWKTAYSTLSATEKRYLWRSIIREIYVENGAVTRVVFL